MKDAGKSVSWLVERVGRVSSMLLLVRQRPRLLAGEGPGAEHVVRVADPEAVLRHRRFDVSLMGFREVVSWLV